LPRFPGKIADGQPPDGGGAKESERMARCYKLIGTRCIVSDD
jgi:hypothetical protein